MDNNENSKTLLSQRIRILGTFALFGGFLVFGVAASILGPTLLTLACNLGKNVTDMTFVVLGKGLGYFLGSLITPIFSRRISQYNLLACSLIMIALGQLGTPLMPSVALLTFSELVAGVGMGVMEIAGYVFVLQTWKEDSDPFIQAGQLTYAVGAALGPLVANPFINVENAQIDNSTTVNTTEINFNVTKMNNFSGASENICYTPVNNSTIISINIPLVTWGYLIVSVSAMFFVSIFLYLSCTQKKLLASQTNEGDVLDNKIFRFVWLFQQFLFCLIHVGTEVFVSVYLYTFLIKSEYNATKDIGTTLNSVWWVAFIFGCLAAVLATKRFSPKQILTIDLTGVSFSVVLLNLFPFYIQTVSSLLWIAIFLYAFFLASIFPTCLTWSARHILVNASAASVFTVAGGTGEMIFKLLVGFHIEDQPNYVIWIMAINTGLMVCLFFGLIKWTTYKKKFPKKESMKNAKVVGGNEDTNVDQIEMKENLLTTGT